MNPEDRLEAIARKLGDDAAAVFDATVAGERVVARLQREGRSSVMRLTRVLMRVAAVAIIAVGIGVVYQAGGGEVDEQPVATAIELSDLSDEELTEVIDSLMFDEPVSQLAANDLYDLDESELAQLLELMEG